MKNKKKQSEHKQAFSLRNLFERKISSIKKISREEKYSWLIFIGLLVIGLYLRFWNIETTQKFGWDQARDAWAIRDILRGHLTLIGPKTGVGYMHTGPLYYYFLAPFYFFTQLDPMASNYFNVIENIINFILIYVVTKKIFGTKAGLFAIFVYAVNLYLIYSGRTAWNVSLMPGMTVLLFYAIYNVYQNKYKWIFIAWLISGFYYNIHFTALFLPLIVLLSLVFVKDKIKALKYCIYSIPLYIVWFIPNIIYQAQGKSLGFLQDFFKYYFVGFHIQFLLYRLPYTLVMFKTMLGLGQTFAPFSVFEYIIPLIFIATVVFFEKERKYRILAYLCGLWFLIPLIGFTMYGGPISEYYFGYDAPIVIFIFIYLQQKLLQVKYKKIILICLVFVWCYYAYQNTKTQWIKPSSGGLQEQKDDAYKHFVSGDKINFNEGDIESYLYQVMVDQKNTSK